MDDYVLKPSHREEYFEVATWVVDDLKEFNREKLVQMKSDKTIVNDDEQKESDQVISEKS